ncbi:hypothetical protein CAEBREN_23517 [Caenorhabditis brenneri]|uniref:RING-type domain-containing protein n=1 Tax=Caenorhabditis brenneri TaxID=135651 RepID=G0P0E4_CAEBE|nr:hypothetical protein CAEBREN_23517 [Caenorhabditis brenneri]
MPAPKRSLSDTARDDIALKRRGRATEVINDDPRDSTSQVAVDDNSIVKLLQECSQKQKSYIVSLDKTLVSWEHRYKRLQLHMEYQLRIGENRDGVNNSIEQQIEWYEKEIGYQNSKEGMLKIIVEEMAEQENTLEKIVKDVVQYKDYKLQNPKEIGERKSNLHGSLSKQFTDAFKLVPLTSRDDSEMESLPKLEKEDLNEIEWPEMNLDWTKYSIYWNREFYEAAECRKLNEQISILEKKLEKAVSDYCSIQTKKCCIESHDKNHNCHIHNNNIRETERTVLSSCGHTVCATCMEHLKATVFPYQWTCHECQAPSDKIVTNWALMKLIKEIPGQPQREVVRVHEAVPIVPAGWRLEQRHHVEPVNQDLQALVDNVGERIRNIIERNEIILRRLQEPNRIFEHPGPVALGALAVAAPAAAPPPLIPLQPAPVLAAQVVEDNDDEPGVILEVAPEAVVAPAPHVLVAPRREQMDVEPAVRPEQIDDQHVVRPEQIEENGDVIEYIVLD